VPKQRHDSFLHFLTQVAPVFHECQNGVVLRVRFRRNSAHIPQIGSTVLCALVGQGLTKGGRGFESPLQLTLSNSPPAWWIWHCVETWLGSRSLPVRILTFDFPDILIIK